MVLSTSCVMTGKTLTEAGIRELGILVLDIERGGDVIHAPVAHDRLQSDDILIVYGHRQAISELARPKGGPPDYMLKVIYLAPNLPLAEMIKGILENEGILTVLRPLGVTQLGGEASEVEILVSESEAEEAAELLNNLRAG